MHVTLSRFTLIMLIMLLFGVGLQAFGAEPCSQANLVDVIKQMQPYLPGWKVMLGGVTMIRQRDSKGLAADCDAECYAQEQVEKAQATLNEQQAYLEQIRREKALRTRVEAVLKDCQPEGK